MKIIYQILVFIFLAGINSYSQKLQKQLYNKEINIINSFKQYDISHLWLCESCSYNGVIGNKNRRIRVRFSAITKSNTDSLTYFVKGKTKVGENIFNFSGLISLYYAVKDSTLFPISETTDVDGLIKGEYIFRESNYSSHTGIFKGELITYWQLNDKNEIILGSGWYTSFDYSFAFQGVWKGYHSQRSLKCCWSNYRIPCVSEDFDTSDGPDVIPSEKYSDVGWGDLRTIFTSYPESKEYQESLKRKKANDFWWK